MNDEGICPPTVVSAQSNPPAMALSRLMPVAMGTFLCSLTLAIFSARCLYADGSNFFLQVLERESFAVFHSSRCFANELIEFPLVLAIWSGVRDLDWLRWVFGVGCFMPWPLALWFCHRLSPRHFWVAALACGAGYLNASFLAVGEYNVAHAFFWPALFALLFARPLTPLAAGLLIVSATIMVFSYESLLFLGPLLAGLGLRRAFGAGEQRWQRGVFLAATILFLGASAIAWQAVCHPDSPENFGGFKQGAQEEMFNPSWTVAWSGIWGLLMLAVCAWPGLAVRLARRSGVMLLSGVILLWGTAPLLMPDRLDPSRQYSARFLDLAVPLVLLPAVWLLDRYPSWFEPRRRHLVALAAGFLLAQSLWHITATWQWHGYVALMKDVLASRSGPVLQPETPLHGTSARGQALRFDWYWATPSLSIAVCPEGRVKSLLLPTWRSQWRPFDPLDPGALPKLQQYGVDYSEYVTSLSKVIPR